MRLKSLKVKFEKYGTLSIYFCREVEEECGLIVKEVDMDYMGIIDFEFKGDPVHLEVHVFLARKFQGKSKETGPLDLNRMAE